jgi:hypothetical protein
MALGQHRLFEILIGINSGPTRSPDEIKSPLRRHARLSQASMCVLRDFSGTAWMAETWTSRAVTSNKMVQRDPTALALEKPPPGRDLTERSSLRETLLAAAAPLPKTR